MRFRSVLTPLFLLLHPFASAGEIAARVAEGFKVETVLAHPGLQAFTWDDRGQVWGLSTSDSDVTLGLWPSAESESFQSVRSFPRSGRGRSTLLASGGRVYFSDGPVLRSFSENGRGTGDALHVPPTHLFPPAVDLTSTAWGPLGEIHFLYHSAVTGEAGIGRYHPRLQRWDVLTKGAFTHLTFDGGGFPVAADGTRGNLFRVAWGLDYDQGLETYHRGDLALKTDRPGLQPALVMSYRGSGWPSGHYGTWLIFNAATSSLEQFKENASGLTHLRTILSLGRGSVLRDLQTGPDGAVWLLTGPAEEIRGEAHGAIHRLTPSTVPAGPGPIRDVSSFKTDELVAQFGQRNSWQQDVALRILDGREELLTIRDLHPGTPVHDAFRGKTNSTTTRVHAFLSLHRLGLLDELLVEEGADDEDPTVRIWAALLMGERGYPTGLAFHKLIALAKDTNQVVRSAAAVAARQFVSGSLVLDTPPRSMPIREVFTGGILSTLWFSTENGSTPEFDLLFWNAVRPITAFDHAHPMGFFNGEKESKLPLAYWIVGLITRQIATSDSVAKQEDAMNRLAELNPDNPRMLLAALRGLKHGSDSRRVAPARRSLEVLGNLSRSGNREIASLAAEIHRAWQKPLK